MREIAKELGMNYVTFDVLSQLLAAQEDPEGFIRALKRPVIIDEVQRVPQIALPIKLSVDLDRTAGSFGLTGSANPLVAPKLNDSLAGRMFILEMWPLSKGEIQDKKSYFLELIFDSNAVFLDGDYWSLEEMIETFFKGGYPDALVLEGVMRDHWYDNLLRTILERDVQDITHIMRPRDLIKVLNVLAARVSNLLNLAEVSRVASIPYATLNHYMVLLESLFLVVRQPAWHVNLNKRLIKMPKIYFADTGLLLNQLGVGKETVLGNGRLLGSVLENFVFTELKKLMNCSQFGLQMYHYRTQSGIEVDFVLENRAGQIVGIEVKASETISPEDWKGLNVLGEEMGDKMIRGVILYSGKAVIALRKDRIAIPLTALWNA